MLKYTIDRWLLPLKYFVDCTHSGFQIFLLSCSLFHAETINKRHSFPAKKEIVLWKSEKEIVSNKLEFFNTESIEEWHHFSSVPKRIRNLNGFFFSFRQNEKSPTRINQSSLFRTWDSSLDDCTFHRPRNQKKPVLRLKLRIAQLSWKEWTYFFLLNR